jgi:outer membrane protein
VAQASPAPGVMAQPTPYPQTTMGPAGSATNVPYPAYGTPVPGVNSGVKVEGVPQKISLVQAIEVGFAKSPALAAARADVGVSQASVRLARAGLLPSLSGTVSGSFNHSQAGTSGFSSSTTSTGSTGTGTSFTSTSRSGNTYSDGVSADLRALIYDGGKIAASVRAATHNETAFADTYRRDLQTVAYNIANAYYTYLAAQRTTAIDLEIVREDQVQEDLVRAQVRAGTAARVDIATAELPVAQARLAVVKAQGNELASQAAFANALGLDANSDVEPIDDAPVFTSAPISTIPIPTYDAALKRAVALRPDYDNSVQTVAAAEDTLRSSRLGLFPTLSTSASVQDNSSDQNGGSFRNAQSVGLSLSIPIYDQGVTRANVSSSQASLDKAKANLQTTTLTVQVNIKQTLTNLVSARAALDQTQVEYDEASQVLKSTQAQYKAGVTTLPLLLNAQVGLTQALTDQVNAVYALRQAEQAFLYALGANTPDVTAKK